MDIPLPFINKTAEQIWKNDSIKINKCIQNGFIVLVIWESEFENDFGGCIKKCVDFLND